MLFFPLNILKSVLLFLTLNFYLILSRVDRPCHFFIYPIQHQPTLHQVVTISSFFFKFKWPHTFLSLPFLIWRFWSSSSLTIYIVVIIVIIESQNIKVIIQKQRKIQARLYEYKIDLSSHFFFVNYMLSFVFCVSSSNKKK